MKLGCYRYQRVAVWLGLGNKITWLGLDIKTNRLVDWRPVQGVPCLHPKSAGIGSSAPATLQRIKRRTYNVQIMDGWMELIG